MNSVSLQARTLNISPNTSSTVQSRKIWGCFYVRLLVFCSQETMASLFDVSPQSSL